MAASRHTVWIPVLIPPTNREEIWNKKYKFEFRMLPHIWGITRLDADINSNGTVECIRRNTFTPFGTNGNTFEEAVFGDNHRIDVKNNVITVENRLFTVRLSQKGFNKDYSRALDTVHEYLEHKSISPKQFPRIVCTVYSKLTGSTFLLFNSLSIYRDIEPVPLLVEIDNKGECVNYIADVPKFIRNKNLLTASMWNGRLQTYSVEGIVPKQNNTELQEKSVQIGLGNAILNSFEFDYTQEVGNGTTLLILNYDDTKLKACISGTTTPVFKSFTETPTMKHIATYMLNKSIIAKYWHHMHSFSKDKTSGIGYAFEVDRPSRLSRPVKTVVNINNVIAKIYRTIDIFLDFKESLAPVEVVFESEYGKIYMLQYGYANKDLKLGQVTFIPATCLTPVESEQLAIEILSRQNRGDVGFYMCEAKRTIECSQVVHVLKNGKVERTMWIGRKIESPLPYTIDIEELDSFFTTLDILRNLES